MNPFLSLRDYQEFVYTLQQRYPAVKVSTLVVTLRGHYDAILQGELLFDKGYRVTLKELLIYEGGSVKIYKYGYTIWRNHEQIAWYDSQPHPDDPTLEATHPHHKHIPPNIKHHRIPAPNMRFDQPNLPAIIEETLALVNSEI